MTKPAAQDPGAQAHGIEMALNRLVFVVLIAVYFIVWDTSPALLLTLLAYMVFASVLYAWLRLRPGRASLLTHGCAMTADVAVISLGMHLDGHGDAALFPLYLWVIQGNGFRFGIKPLFAATGLSFLGFGLVVAFTPYWRQQPVFSASLLAALVVLPIYSSALIRRLSRARSQAEEASRAKSMFLAAISHELRTPLNAILGSVSLIEGTPLNDEQHGLFMAMRTGTQALLSLIGSVLNFSRVEAGLMPVANEPVDLAALLVEVRDLVAIQARMKSLQLSIHVASPVPRHVSGDRIHLLEVLLNLAANAIKFTETGGVGISVDVSPQGPGDDATLALRFEVTDTGIGIAHEAQARIFDMFSQADATILDRFGGTGLGLAISRQLVTLMGGRIGVSSTPGRGSTFWFTLPAAAPASEPPATPAVGARATLICDDADLAATAEAALRAAGMTVRRSQALHGVLAGAATAQAAEILVLYRRDPFGELTADCAMLGRLDPRGTIPRILLSPEHAPSLPPLLLKRHFITTLTLPADGEAWSRALHLAASALPRSWPEIAPEAPGDAAPSGMPASPQTAVRSLQVLVADDNDINRRVIGKILERAGHRVTLAGDGLQALDAMETRSLEAGSSHAGGFDLVLMDVNMPGMNGLEATQMFRMAAAPSPRLPIVALTADATLETEQRCLQAGMDGCITKPITPARLIGLIEALVPQPSRDDAVTPISEHPRFLKRTPALDLEILAELRALGGEDFVADLLENFIADAEALIERIEAEVACLNMTGFRFELHALCSGAANIGAASIRDVASARDVTGASLGNAGPVLVHRLRQELSALQREWRLSQVQTGLSSG